MDKKNQDKINTLITHVKQHMMQLGLLTEPGASTGKFLFLAYRDEEHMDGCTNMEPTQMVEAVEGMPQLFPGFGFLALSTLLVMACNEMDGHKNYKMFAPMDEATRTMLLEKLERVRKYVEHYGIEQ